MVTFCPLGKRLQDDLLKQLLTILACTLVLACAPKTTTLSLVDQFPSARQGIVVQGAGFLGGEGYQAFLGEVSRHGDWVSASDGQIRASFFLHSARPLRLTLELDTPKGQQVSCSVNQQSLASQKLKDGQQLIELELGPEQVRKGINWLELQGDPTLRWRSLLIEPPQPSLSAQSGRLVRPRIDETSDSLLLPFGQPLEYPIRPQGLGTLSLQIEPWVEPGIAPLESDDFELVIRWRSDAVASEKVFRRAERGVTKLELLPLNAPGSLLLEATHKGRPLPGQLGLRLRQPVLATKFEPKAANPGPTTTPPEFFQNPGSDGLLLGQKKYLGSPPTLYDLAQDPQEEKNLILELPVTGLHLDSLLRRHRSLSDLDPQSKNQYLEDLRTLQYLH